VSKHQVQKSKYLLNPVVDDYNIRDEEFDKRAANMKHISAHFTPTTEWIRKFAWFPIRSDISQKIIWLTHYWKYAIKMDSQGAVPHRANEWTLIYTRQEYITKKLQGEINE